jgi:hypothetical protein
MIELTSGIFLLAFSNPAAARTEIGETIKEDSEIIFKGDLSLLMELASKFVLQIQPSKFKDYFYHSTGFDSPTMSLQSAIWASEESQGKSNVLTYFVILKKIRSKVA